MDADPTLMQLIAHNAIWIAMIFLYPMWVALGKYMRVYAQKIISPKKNNHKYTD